MSTEPIPTYEPKPGSTAWQVCKFLTDNPDEELERGDVVTKFGGTHATIDTTLQLAVSRGVLRRTRNASSELVWLLASADNLRLLPLPLPASEDRSMSDVVRNWGASSPSTAADMADLPAIRPNTPLLDDKARREFALATWLGQFAVGSSAEFGESQLKEIKRAKAAYTRAHPAVVFIFAKMSTGVHGIERRPDAQPGGAA